MRIVKSGGQSGVDLALLDAAIETGFQHGGWCPRGRMNEDGGIPEEYLLRETPSSDYGQRTTWNIRDSNATVVLVRNGVNTPGTRKTIRELIAQGKDYYVVDLASLDVMDVNVMAQALMKYDVVNFAGPRESKEPGIYVEALRYGRTLLSTIADLQRNANEVDGKPTP